MGGRYERALPVVPGLLRVGCGDGDWTAEPRLVSNRESSSTLRLESCERFTNCGEFKILCCSAGCERSGGVYFSMM